MRIIAGELGGRRLRAPDGDATRPTAERVREALFSILGPPRPGLQVLDGFAGAGTLGLEALSRGAGRCWFIERAPAAVRCLRGNIAALELGERAQLRRGDTIPLLKRWEKVARDDPAGAPARAPSALGWVFLDPPYRSDLAAQALTALGSGRLLTADVRVVVEHDWRNPPDPAYGCLIQTSTRRYGDTALTFYELASTERTGGSP
ncbi:MAG: 16S rRNA (guanine(966)-N(2))-methyltransferase RsmD [Haliangiales bacterium]